MSGEPRVRERKATDHCDLCNVTGGHVAGCPDRPFEFLLNKASFKHLCIPFRRDCASCMENWTEQLARMRASGAVKLTPLIVRGEDGAFQEAQPIDRGATAEKGE